jgi:TetR/AcrR family transcriptional repressor of nem operon
VPKGTFYAHFDSKERFGADVLGRYWEDLATRAQAILSDESKTPLARLRAYFAEKTQPRPTSSKGCMIGIFAAELSMQS